MRSSSVGSCPGLRCACSNRSERSRDRLGRWGSVAILADAWSPQRKDRFAALQDALSPGKPVKASNGGIRSCKSPVRGSRGRGSGGSPKRPNKALCLLMLVALYFLYSTPDGILSKWLRLVHPSPTRIQAHRPKPLGARRILPRDGTLNGANPLPVSHSHISLGCKG